jgi:hypothetical protein
MDTNYKPMVNPVGKPVETNLLKLIALQNGLKLNSGKGIVKVKKILFNSLTLN